MPVSSFPRSYCLSVRCSKISKRVSLFYGPCTFHTSAGSGQVKSLCELFKNGLSFIQSSMVLLDIVPIVFKVMYFGDLFHMCRIQGLGSLMWITDPSILKENFCIFDILRFVVHRLFKIFFF